MEQEKKKRVRPTVAQVKELERVIKLGEKDLADANRECEELQKKNETLEHSNKLMEDEMNVLRSKVALLEEIADNRAAEVERMRSRGFFARVFNR